MTKKGKYPNYNQYFQKNTPIYKGCTVNTYLHDWYIPVLCFIQKRSRYVDAGDQIAWVFIDPVVGHLAAKLYILAQEGRIDLSESTLQSAKVIYLKNIARWMQREHRLKATLEVLYCAGISIIPLKGAILQSQLYNNCGLRPMSDIDILVQPDAFLPAAYLLLEHGFSLSIRSGFQDLAELEILLPEQRPGLLEFRDEQGLMIEIHQNLMNSKWFLPAYPINIKQVWERSISLSDAQQSQKELGNGLWKRLLSPYDMLGHLCLHVALHGLQPRQTYLDIDLWIRSLPETWQWEQFLDLVNQWGIRSVTYHALSFCRDFMQTPLPDGLLERLDPGWPARLRVKWLISSQSILANRITLGRRYPALIRLALVDHVSRILVTLIKLAFPEKVWRAQNPSWQGLLAHWSHVLHVIKRGD